MLGHSSGEPRIGLSRTSITKVQILIVEKKIIYISVKPILCVFLYFDDKSFMLSALTPVAPTVDLPTFYLGVLYVFPIGLYSITGLCILVASILCTWSFHFLL